MNDTDTDLWQVRVWASRVDHADVVAIYVVRQRLKPWDGQSVNRDIEAQFLRHDGTWIDYPPMGHIQPVIEIDGLQLVKFNNDGVQLRFDFDPVNEAAKRLGERLAEMFERAAAEG